MRRVSLLYSYWMPGVTTLTFFVSMMKAGNKWLDSRVNVCGAIIRRVRLIHNLGCDCDCGRRRLISGPQQRRRQRASRQFVLASSVHASLSTPKLPITRSQTTPRPTINDRSCLRPTRHQSDLLLYFFVRVCPRPRRAGPWFSRGGVGVRDDRREGRCGGDLRSFGGATNAVDKTKSDSADLKSDASLHAHSPPPPSQ